eukprot:495746_1
MSFLFVSYITWIVCCHAYLNTRFYSTKLTNIEGINAQSYPHNTISTLLPTSLTLTQKSQRFTAENVKHQTNAINAMNASNTISRTNVTPLSPCKDTLYSIGLHFDACALAYDGLVDYRNAFLSTQEIQVCPSRSVVIDSVDHNQSSDPRAFKYGLAATCASKEPRPGPSAPTSQHKFRRNSRVGEDLNPFDFAHSMTTRANQGIWVKLRQKKRKKRMRVEKRIQRKAFGTITSSLRCTTTCTTASSSKPIIRIKKTRQYSAHYAHFTSTSRVSLTYAAVPGSLLAFIAINHMHCVTHMSSVLIWLLLASHQMLIPAQAQSMNGSSFSCTGQSECGGFNIQCNDDQDCLVQCSGTYSCQVSYIHGPSNANLVVDCSGAAPCTSATINGPTNGNLTVICHGNSYSQVCGYVDIYCPIYGGCEVQCLSPGSKGCWYSVLDARSMINGSVSLHLASGFSQSTVYCPGNGNECIITCESGRCQSAIIRTEPDSQLFITAEGVNTLQNSAIYCPAGVIPYINGECSITIAGAGGALSSTKIYAVNGLNNLSLICNYTLNVSDCYDDSLRPQLFCLPA